MRKNYLDMYKIFDYKAESYVSDIIINQSGHFMSITSDRKISAKDNENYMILHSVGHVDKKEAVLYEGDFVETECGIGVIIFHKNEYLIKVCSDSILITNFSDVEKIGNVFENYSLLKKSYEIKVVKYLKDYFRLNRLLDEEGTNG